MPMDVERLLAHRFPEHQQSYAERDAILYALGVGLGADPLDPADLDYLLETQLKVLPTYSVTLASPGMWIRDPAFGVDFTRLVHARQDAVFHAPLPPAGSVRATPRVASLHDRGAGRGAVLVIERDIIGDDDRLHASVSQTLLLRGDGGYGGEPPPATARRTPDRDPDHWVEVAISPRAALIYRLSGDYNPLHADPSFAKAAGFERPILHGLATYGIAGRALMGASGKSLSRLACRFAGVVMPGDVIEFSLWEDGSEILFEAHVEGRCVLDSGEALLEA